MHSNVPRMPPHSEKAEKALLGAVLLDGGIFPGMAESVTADDFYATDNGRIWGAFARLHATGKRIDAVTVLDQLERDNAREQVGGEPYLAHLAGLVPSAAGAEDYAQIVRDKAVRRSILDATTEIQLAAHKGTVPGDELLGWAAAQVAGIERSGGAIRGLVRPFDGIADPVAELTKPKGGLLLNIPGMYDILPAISDEIVLIGGPPSLGKSTLTMQVADAAIEQGWTVLMIAYEQGWKTLEKISAARLGRINSRSLTEGTTSESVLRALRGVWTEERIETLRERRIYADPLPMSVAEIKKRIEQVQRGLDQPRKLLPVIDGIHDIPTTGAASRREGMDDIVIGLRSIARVLEIPILSTVHVNDNGDPKESRGLGYKCDISLTIAAGEGEPRDVRDACDTAGIYKAGPVEILVRKNRDAEAGGTVELDFHKAIREFRVGVGVDGF